MYQVGQFIIRNACNFPDRLAVVTSGERLTWLELNGQCNRIAHGMLEAGIKQGTRVAVLWESGTDWLSIFYACQKIGAAVLPLSTILKPEEIERIVEIAECDVIFFSEKYRESARLLIEGTSHRLLFVTDAGDPSSDWLAFESLKMFDNATEAQIELAEEDESLILFTSGTNGRSKGVIRSQKMVTTHALCLEYAADLSLESQTMITSAPIFHTAAFLAVLKMAALGGTVIFLQRNNPELMLRMIEEYRATQILMMPPIIYKRLLKPAAERGYDLSSIKEALVSAGRCSQETAETIFGLFPNTRLRVSWGSTETCSVTGALVSQAQIAANDEMTTAVGFLNRFNEVRLVDDLGSDVATGEVGEALVCSPMVCKGYLDDSCCQESPFEGDWFRTGDLLKRDEKGLFYFMDRKKDMIKTGGENVYALEVERVLLQHPSIKDCAIVGVADECFGEAIAVAIVLVDGKELTDEELVAFSKQNLESFKKPRYVAYLDELPRNSVGKPLKTVLREQADRLFRAIQM